MTLKLLPYIIDDTPTNTGHSLQALQSEETVRATGGCPQLIDIASAVPYIYSREGVRRYGLPQLMRMQGASMEWATISVLPNLLTVVLEF